jgi:hypothetical protein
VKLHLAQFWRLFSVKLQSGGGELRDDLFALGTIVLRKLSVLLLRPQLIFWAVLERLLGLTGELLLCFEVVLQLYVLRM